MQLKDWLVKDLSILSFKFFSDEDIDARLIKFLSDKGIDIKYAERGIRNSKLYSLACKESRAILTRDKDFLNTSLFSPTKLPLIVVLRIHPPTFSRLKSPVLKFFEKLSDEMKGKTWAVKEESFSEAD